MVNVLVHEQVGKANHRKFHCLIVYVQIFLKNQ